MANPLALELHASAARTSSGSGTAKDIGALRTAARVQVALTASAAGADNLLTLSLETSASEAGPWESVTELGTFPAQAPVRLNATVAGLQRYVRPAWTIAGAAPSFTFQVTATAHVVYAEPDFVKTVGAAHGAIAEAEPNKLVDFCIMASVESDGHLALGRKLPLTAWDTDDLGFHNAKIVVYRFLNAPGRMPTGPDDLIDIEFNAAIKWLRGVGAGSIDPPGLVDSTPDISEDSFAVVSAPPREW